MIPEGWKGKPAYLQAAQEAVGEKRVWNDDGFQELLGVLVGDGELEGEVEVPKTWVLEIAALVKRSRKADRKAGEWSELPARKRWIALAGKALIAMHALPSEPLSKPTAGYHGDF